MHHFSRVNTDPYGAVLRAARWAEEHHKPTGHFVDTWTILYEIAGKVAAGELDLGDMTIDIRCPWSDVITYLEAKGIDVALEAHRRGGSEPSLVFENGLQVWPPLA